ncbi:hypothetical protein PWY87_20650 [Kribbella solani]|uniref:hypothetical protein n=1 Tax=Kribbella solani TaxID=236067 RepID=UPI0029AFC859|nr:hypothetical protein [Kribbella solani]MDX3004112.1 hypothetical protein [Kribbella solani]
MTQPTEGPQPGRNWDVAMDRIGQLDDKQWGNVVAIASADREIIDKMIAKASKPSLKTRLNNKIREATGRVQAVYTHTAQRLSEGAVQLASQARQFGENVADRATEFGQEVAGRVQAGREAVGQAIQQGSQAVRDRATEFGQAASDIALNTRDSVVQGAQAAGQAIRQGAQVVGDRATEFGQATADVARAGWDATVDGAQVAGQAVQQGARATADAAVAGGQRVAEAGRNVADRASRWGQVQKTRGSIIAEGARATMAALRNIGDDPTLRGVQAKDAVHLAAGWSKVHEAAATSDLPTREAATGQALEGIVTTSQEQQRSGDGERAALAALGGVASPQAIAGQPPAQGTGENTQNPVNLTKGNDNKGIGGR